MKRRIAGLLKWLLILGLGAPLLLLIGPIYVLSTNDLMSRQWGTANRESAGLSPAPLEVRDAVVQVFAARTFGWRGAFAVHTWIATKEAGAEAYRVHHVIGWRSGNKVVSRPDIPDRHWYGSAPILVSDIRGTQAETLIPQILEAIERYPYADRYRAWPGPNSNTFTAWIAREVPGWDLTLPGLAVGKDFLGDLQPVAFAPSRTGIQISIYGLLGTTIARKEGVELNILGLTLGFRPSTSSILLPGFGTVSWQSP